ncbi:MAG: hypothetical protein EBS79_04500 [Gammaproteobacteria bacterium]|nr:hypothetical protein [Gammaproteobacteria bacterium]NBY22724.1 hypothetical protein [Gammaproteobacteria bacterium]
MKRFHFFLSVLLLLTGRVVFAGGGNSPWYPSLQAFEHFDSARSHVFEKAQFLGAFQGKNTVDMSFSPPGSYPSGYNMSYLNAKASFIQGGSYGDIPGSIGPFVAKVDPQTLKPLWFTQLQNTVETGDWDYPGAMAIEMDGFIYVVSGYKLYKVAPRDGKVLSTLDLPTMVYMRTNYPATPATYATTLTDDSQNTSYNGLNALPDGTIVVKSLYRVAGCTLNGPSALLNCPDAKNVPASNLISINPRTLKIIDNITLPAPASARPTITSYRGVNYVYLLENTSTPVRYAVKKGVFKLDTSWTPPAVSNSGQEPGGSLIVLNDWIVGATNTVPATGALTVFAVSQGDGSKYWSVQPYINDPVAPELAAAFSTASPGGLPAISWAGMSLEADPKNNLFYGVETLARKIAAFTITNEGIQTVWKKTQTTTEWATLIGPKNTRVWVGTDIPGAEIPGQNVSDEVVWRDARTGRELARSDRTPAITQGTAVQPGYSGSMYLPGAKGVLVKLKPKPFHP